jgi:hypothetical protein
VVPRSTAKQPAPDAGLLATVLAYLRQHAPPAAHIQVTGPEWRKINVTVTVVPTSFGVADTLASAVASALTQFLHPLTGGFAGTGWPFGAYPRTSDLYRCVSAVSGVDSIQSLVMNPSESSFEQEPPAPTSLICAGAQRVKLGPPDGGG